VRVRVNVIEPVVLERVGVLAGHPSVIAALAAELAGEAESAGGPASNRRVVERLERDRATAGEEIKRVVHLLRFGGAVVAEAETQLTDLTARVAALSARMDRERTRGPGNVKTLNQTKYTIPLISPIARGADTRTK